MGEAVRGDAFWHSPSPELSLIACYASLSHLLGREHSHGDLGGAVCACRLLHVLGSAIHFDGDMPQQLLLMNTNGGGGGGAAKRGALWCLSAWACESGSLDGQSALAVCQQLLLLCELHGNWGLRFNMWVSCCSDESKMLQRLVSCEFVVCSALKCSICSGRGKGNTILLLCFEFGCCVSLAAAARKRAAHQF